MQESNMLYTITYRDLPLSVANSEGYCPHLYAYGLIVSQTESEKYCSTNQQMINNSKNEYYCKLVVTHP